MRLGSEEPILDSINFLNEVISRFPEAISFAPGAPNPIHLNEIDVTKYIARYVQHLCATREITRAQAYHVLYQYGPAAGLINDLVATALRKHNDINVSAVDVVITVGAQEAMFITLRALFRTSHEKLAVVTPCFVGILGAARLLGIEVIGINEAQEGINLKQLEQVCIAARESSKPIRALYVAPDYSNPSGSLLSLKGRLELLQLAERHDLWLLEDNAYSFTAPPGEEIPTLKSLDKTNRVIFIGTFAKICLPGARVGYVVADPTLAKDLATIKSMITVNTSPICQALIGGILLERDTSIKMLEREKSKFYRNNLALLLNALDRYLPQESAKALGISWSRPAGGFFVRMRLPIATNMALLEVSASKYGVLWTPMSSFYLNEQGTNELRLSCSYLSGEQIEEGIRRFSHFLQNVIN